MGYSNALRSVSVICAVFGVAGCTTWNLGPSSPPAEPTPSDINSRIEAICKAESCPTRTPADYAIAGYDLAKGACNSYFDNLIAASNDVQETKSDLAAAGTAAATIEALANTATNVIGYTAAGVGLAGVLFDNYQNYSLITPYPVQTRELVLAALDTYRSSLKPENATSFIDASDRIAGYAELCTYSSIASLAQQALAKAKTIDTGSTVFGAIDIPTLQAINSALGFSSTLLDDTVYEELAIIASSDGSPAARTLNAVIAKLLPPDVLAVAYNSATEGPTPALQKAAQYLSNLANGNKAFGDRINAIKAANEQSIRTAAAANARHPAAVGGPKPPQPVLPPTPSPVPHIVVQGG